MTREHAATLGAVGALAAELKRRHVVRVGVVYCAVGWVVAEVSATFLPALGIPDWSVSLVAVLLVLGLPIALVLAWAFDLTPDGVRRTPGTPMDFGATRAMVGAGSAAVAPVATVPSGAAAAAPPGPALAALPFDDRSPGAEHQYLGDGITEELINALARLDGLHVVSRTSAFAMRAEAMDARQVGERLGVTHVVEGSIRVSERRLRVAAQLVDVAHGFAVWAGTFDRTLDDVFCVQEDIARALVRALQPALHGAGADVPALLRTSASSFEAYALYLRGRQQWNERTPDALRRALRHFEEALALDPDYAAAHAGIADCWAILVDHGIADPAEGLPAARRSADAALRLDPRLAEAHTSGAMVKQLEWDWAGAEAGFREALRLNSGYVTARQRLALLLAWLGRTGEARREIDRALRADPLSSAVAASAGWIEYYDGKYDDAIRIQGDVLRHHPGAAAALVPLALALVRSGRPDEAVSALRAGVDSENGSPASPVLAIVAYALGAAGRHDEASRVLAMLEGAETFVSPFTLAQARLGTGDADGVTDALEEAAATRAPQLVYLLSDPMFEEIRNTPAVRRIIDTLRPPA
jgi:TolB-like protein